MPFAEVNNTRLFYRLEGRGDLPALVLSHSLGCDHSMWAPQMPDLLDHFQVLRYDTRGHGASAVPTGDYTLDQLGQDALGLADKLELARFAFCGLSMGGAVSQWLAIHAPGRLTALVLANTSPRFGTPDTWEDRRKAVREGGMQAIVDVIMQRFFSPDKQNSVWAQSTRAVVLGTDPKGYAACCAALRDADMRAALGNISVPTIVIGCDKDLSTPWQANGAILARDIPGAKAVRLQTAHLSNLEQPRAFTTTVLDFLLAEKANKDPFEAGMAVRREVLGDDHVDRSLKNATDFTRDFQELITRYAWGAVWTRPGLDHRTRRLLVLSVTAALGRWEEFRLHLRAGLDHDLEVCDVKETLLQVAVYAGVPAANTAFQIGKEEIDRLGQETMGQ
ncbi:MAG: 4-carboxymuconolactone decarboxylase / 3-oxoadipate enol-lactonase [Candidatus Angelobacter sp.]|nr:4-carboxymuconolactone decarboxylase / 3-oxoadipate enol-lactonase [Candidatus Angelobacter sp.]